MGKQEKRHRPHTARTRLSDEEFAQFRAQAQHAEMSLSALIRQAVLNQNPPPASHQPSPNPTEISQLKASLCELAQALRDATQTGDQSAIAAQIEATRRDIVNMSLACRQALGRRP